jgi:hypothetical protein
VSARTPSPAVRALVLVYGGITLVLTASVARWVTGYGPLKMVAAVGFALQVAGWVAYRRRNGGAA